VAATAVAGRCEQCRQSTVFVEAEKECRHDRQPTSVKDTRTEYAVFRTENKQSNKNPKGYVSLVATIHRKPPVFAAGRMYFMCQRFALVACGFYFYYIIFQTAYFCVRLALKKVHFFTFFPIYFVAKIEKKRYNDIILNCALANMRSNLTENGCK
jgi:hypothetical protein